MTMPADKPEKSDRHKIIIGIDYGTTFSGISYVTTDKTDFDDINIISSWPGKLDTAWKTPTRIAYSSENNSIACNKWGFEVGPKVKSYSWTKLLLDGDAPKGTYDDPALANMSGIGMLRLPHWRNAPGVCEDFLCEMYLYLSTKLQQQMSKATFDMTPMECWITLPAIWSEEAKDATLTAAKNAGFGSRADDEIYTIAEPEAAAVATLSKFTGAVINAVKPDEYILICDCGGGTVDITTYRIFSVAPVLEFDEICVGNGGKCGSTYIDRNLHKLLSERFGEAFDNVPHAQKGPGSKLMTCFEQLKQDFGRNDDRGDRELSPINLGLPDSPFYDSEERMVPLSYIDMQKLFDPVIANITELITQQVKEVQRTQKATIDRIILVGGFGDSAYLNQILRQWCSWNGINLMCPQHPQAAVVRGAALRGLQELSPRVKQARYHYGYTVGQEFREGVDPENLSYIEPFTGKKWCDLRMSWEVSKGDAIFFDTYRSMDILVTYIPGEPTYNEIVLCSCSLDVAPEYRDSEGIRRVGTIISTIDKDYDLTEFTESRWNPALGRIIYRFPLTVQVIFGNKGSNLTFRTLVKGQVMSTATIRYDKR